MPVSLSPDEAGGVPIVGLTAHETLISLLAVTEDDLVLVSAAAGGVGHLAVQLASVLGARVAATTSTRNQHFFLADLGVETVFDYNEIDDLAKAIGARYPGGVDKLLNCVAGETASDYVWTLRDDGKMVDLPRET